MKKPAMQTENRLILTNMRFRLGQLAATPGALAALAEQGKTPQEFVQRHASCDWSDMDTEDATANTLALLTGARIFSSFNLPQGGKVWVITEADRSSTTLLLPEEY
jgi:hypothetical protein